MQDGLLHESARGFKAHLLEGAGRVFHGLLPAERLVLTRVTHEVGDEGQVTVVHFDVC